MTKCVVDHIAALALMAASCEKVQEGDYIAKAVLTMCDGYTTTLDQLASMREQGRLSQETIDKVDDARITANAVCLNADGLTSSAGHLLRLSTAVATLSQAKETNQ